jgi:hypothetical protein
MAGGEATSDELWAILQGRREDLVAAWSDAVQRAIASASLPRAELVDRMPDFVDEVIAALHPGAIPLPPLAENAGEHGAQRLRMGFDVAEVVHEYGLLHGCILDLAEQAGITMTMREQRIIVRWLNSGVADAVAQYVRQRDMELQRQTSEHLGFIAHELRNPLATARLAFEHLRRNGGDLGERWRIALDRNLRHTVDLIDGVLGQASLEMGVEPKLEPIDLASFLHEIAFDAEAEAQSRHIETVVSAEDGLTVDADRRLLRSAVSNLLHNALKFSQPDSKVTITAERTSGRLLVEVADSCGGLPPGKAEELFAPLIQRGQNRSGFGLGLAIALQAAQAHNGTIKVTDHPGIGCQFTIDLPASGARDQPG